MKSDARAVPNRCSGTARRRWGPVGIALAVLLGAAALYRAQQAVREELPAYLHARLGEALGRPVRFGAIRFSPLGVFIIEQVSVPAAGSETEAPLRARAARVHVAWGELLSRRQLRVSGIELVEPEVVAAVDLRAADAGRSSLNRQILNLSATGLESLGVRDGAFRLTATLPGGDVERIAARGISGELGITPVRFAYRGEAREWDQEGGLGQLRATALSVRGDGDERATRIGGGQLAYRGGHLQARGIYREQEHQVTLRVAVRQFPLEEAARRMGAAGEWRLAGRVTGELEVAAANGELRRVTGLLTANAGELRAAGMSKEFAWDAASARLDWNQERVHLDALRVSGDGIRVSGSASVEGRPETIATAGHYHARARVDVAGQPAAARLGEILAFRSPLGGGWSASGAEFDLEASGPVARFGDSRATGRFQLSGLRVQPAGADAPVVTQRVSGDFVRDSEGLRLRSLVAEAPGIRAEGRLQVLNEVGGQPVRFESTGRVVVRDSKALQRLVPRAAMWRWLGSDSPGAGEIEFQASGPVARLGETRATGRFHLRSARITLPEAAPGAAPCTLMLTVDRLRGRFAHDPQALQLTELDISARPDALRAGGTLTVTGLLSPEPHVKADLRVSGDGLCAILPRLPGAGARLREAVRGGRFEGVLSVAGRVSRLAEASFRGSLTLRAPTLVWGGGELPVRTLAVRFNRAGDRVRFDHLRMDADGVQASAAITVDSVGAPDPVVNARVEVGVERWQRFTALPVGVREHLHGGRVTAAFAIAGPISRLAAGPESGRFRVSDATLAWEDAAGNLISRPVSLLDGEFRRDGAGLRLDNLRLRARGLDASGEVRLEALTADPEIRIAGRAMVDSWQDLPGLPAAVRRTLLGGRLQLDVAAQARASRLATAPLYGKLQLSGAAVRVKDPVDGPQELQVRSLAGRFVREGAAVRFTDLSLAAPGIHAEGSLRIAALDQHDSPLSADLRVRAEEWDRLPVLRHKQFGGLRGGRLSLAAAGEARINALSRGSWKGSIRLADAELLAPDGSHMTRTPVESVAGRFARLENGWELSGLELRTSLALVEASGMVTDHSSGAPRLELKGLLISSDAGALLNRLASLPAFRGGTATGEFQLATALAAGSSPDIRGWLAIRDGTWAAGGGTPVPVESFRTGFKSAPPGVALEAAELVLPTLRLTGSGTLRLAKLGGGAGLDAQVHVESERWKETLGLGEGWEAVTGGLLALDGRLVGNSAGLALERGTFVLAGPQLHLPGEAAPAVVDSLTGRFERASSATRLVDLRLASAVVTAQGEAELRDGGGGHRFRLRWQATDPGALLETVAGLPGRLRGGSLAGSVTLGGRPGQPVAELEGDFRLAGALYTPPVSLSGPLGRIEVTSLTGRLRGAGQRVVLDDLRLQSPALALSGGAELQAASGGGDSRARLRLELPDVGQLLSRWPALGGIVDGGHGRADLALVARGGDWSRLTGHGTIEAWGGHLVIPGVESKFRRATLSPLKADFEWDDRQVRLHKVTLRGDNYNLDAAGRVGHGGEVGIAGRGWLTRGFGRSLMPKGVVGFLGRLVGIIPKEVATDFSIRGTLQRPILHAGITNRSLWKHARKSLAPEVRRMATGQAPLWDLTDPDDRRRLVVAPAVASGGSAGAR